jgi:hypothetical protein
MLQQKLRTQFDNLIPPSDTVCVKDSTETPTPKTSTSVWQKAPGANLIRYVPSGTFFARLRVDGKLIRRSLETKVLSVAKLRVADFVKAERQRAAHVDAFEGGKMTFGDALETFRQRFQNDASLKPRTKPKLRRAVNWSSNLATP